ncbi:MAG: bifunctional glutamate N-acetyltransferase/amino-acid acetyltransferase ArgJ [Lachnospiraceae bacterium]|nr:bifunctional glutamate N-acetyltransferase/amino-acid acetyltransferase ArgJ [Lachnospiraceae bacterium]
MASSNIQKIEGGVTAATGFMAAHTGAGIKYTGRDDMAMIYSPLPCRSAGTYTRNVVKAAPVEYDRMRTENTGDLHAVVINAGIANACTGAQGLKACQETSDKAAELLGIRSNAVLVASTGVIGMQLPMDKVFAGIEAMTPNLSETIEAGHDAAKAIMTTDTHPKECAVTFEIQGKKCTLGGMTKGSGMIHPNMGTMLCFITTDCEIEKWALMEALKASVNDSFNMVSVDGDTSTNDTCVLLANGAAGNPLVTMDSEDYQTFLEALRFVTKDLAKQIAGDGEGASHLFIAHVLHANSDSEARVLAKSVITSNLTKAAIFGKDANWGRILCALGYSGVHFHPENVDLYFESENGKIKLVENGVALNYSEEEATKILSAQAVTAICDMKDGEAEAEAYGCDLTYDYVKINADYRS